MTHPEADGTPVGPAAVPHHGTASVVPEQEEKTDG
jgi:hypothetical protein